MSTPERPGLAGNFIAGLIREGLSPTAGLRSFREAGGAVRTQSWFMAWREAQAAIRRAGTIGEAPLGARPVHSELSRGTWRTRERYTFMVDVLVRPTGLSDVFRTSMAVTSDRLLTYDEALAQAVDYAGTDLEAYEESVLGGVVTGVFDRDYE